MKCKVSLLALVLKDLLKGKLTNTFQHIQVYKSQENQMSKNSRKLWKAYIHFPYDLMKLHTFKKLLSFSVNLFACQLYPPRKLTPWALCPSDFKYSPLAGAPPRARTRLSNREMRTRLSVSRTPGTPPCPTPHCHVTSTVAFVNLAMFRTPTANSLRILKWHRDQEKVHACPSVQESSSYVLRLGLRKKTREMENRSLNSRLAVMSLLGGWEPDAEGQVLGLDLILWVFGELGFLLSWSLQVPDLFD